MTVFDDAFESGFAALLTQFGETVTYIKQDGTEREISAIVDRDPPEFFDAGGKAVAPIAMVQVHDDSTKGITAEELNTGGDKLRFPAKKGGAASSRIIDKLIDGEGGVTEFRVR